MVTSNFATFLALGTFVLGIGVGCLVGAFFARLRRYDRE